MPSSAIGAIGTTPPPTVRNRGMQSLTSEDFFKLLVTELRQQDPLQPSNTTDMIANVSQIRSIELSSQLTSTLDQLAAQQRTAGVSDLLGKYVIGKQPDGSSAPPTQGVVTGIRFSSEGVAVLELDNGLDLAASEVTQVHALTAHPDLTALSPGAMPPEAATDETAKMLAARQQAQQPQRPMTWADVLLPRGLPKLTFNSSLSV